MGKSSNPTTGYWYKLLYHTGLTFGPIDAFLEFRGGDKTAWSGRLTASGTISINQPNLWGGEKDQGGIVSDVHVMFGEATQVPDPYLVANLGNQVAAWRGFTTLAFLGGYYGANNPYPQSAAYKVEKILQGWDDGCWYPETAQIVLVAGEAPMLIERFASGNLSDYSALEGVNDGFSVVTEDGGFALQTGAASVAGHNVIGRPLPVTTALFRLRTRFNLKAIGADDAGAFSVRDAAGNVVAALVSCRDAAVDALRRPSVSFRSVLGAPGELIGSGPVTIDRWYLFDATYDAANLRFKCFIQDELSGDMFGELDVPVTAREDVSFLAWTVDDITGAGTTVWDDAQVIVGNNSGAINPAHALYYLRTHSTKGREPTTNMNDASFRAAADKLFGEGFGICVTIDPSKESVVDVEKRICKLIGGSMTRSMVDGQYYLDLARGDYVLDDLPILSDDDILSFQEQPTTLDGAVNSVSVRYFDPQRKETIITPAVEALGLIDEFGLNHQVMEYPEIPTAALAARIAERDLLSFITPTRLFDLTTTRKPYSWRPNTYFRLQAPKYGIADMVCIVGDKQAGTLKSGAIRMQAVQDIYTLPEFGSVEVETGVDTAPPATPVAITAQIAFEAPYINVAAGLSNADLAALPADVGFLIAAAQDPANSRDFTLSVDAGAGYQEKANGAWCPTAVINEAAPLVDPLPVDFTLGVGNRLDQVAVGDPVLWGSEICRVDALDVGANTLTLGRACADTVPQTHAAGETIWFWSEGAAYDNTEYTDGEAVDAKLLTNTWSQRLDAASATAISITFDHRQARPYPPGKVRIDGSARPSTVTGEFVVTWAHRDRILQANQLIDTEAESVGPEESVRYALQLIDDATDAVLIEKLDIAGATATCDLAASGDVRLVLYSISDIADSWQRHEHVFAFTAAGGSDSITADTYEGTIIFHDGGEVIP